MLIKIINSLKKRMAKGNSPNRREIITEESLELQKGKINAECLKSNRLDFSWVSQIILIVEAKMVTPSDVGFSILRDNA